MIFLEKEGKKPSRAAREGEKGKGIGGFFHSCNERKKKGITFTPCFVGGGEGREGKRGEGFSEKRGGTGHPSRKRLVGRPTEEKLSSFRGKTTRKKGGGGKKEKGKKGKRVSTGLRRKKKAKKGGGEESVEKKKKRGESP